MATKNKKRNMPGLVKGWSKQVTKHICGTCSRWIEGRIGIVGDCSAEMEGTTRNQECKINLWIEKDKKG